MTPEGYAWLARLHGLLATLGLAVLMHPVITLRTRRALTPTLVFTADLAAVLLAGPFLLGLVLYPAYRAKVKPALWLGHPGAVLRFETKEHLAAMAVALVVGGALTLRVAGRHPAGRDAAWMMLLCGWALALVAALSGLWVAGRAHPAW